MHRILTGLLIAAVAASPALADKGGKGPKGGAKHSAKAAHGGGGNYKVAHGGSGKHKAARSMERHARAEMRGPQPRHQAREQWRHQAPAEWRREARFDPPVRVARADDKRMRKALKREIKAERRVQRAAARQDRLRPSERWVRAAPAPVHYQQPAYQRVVRYAAPVAPIYYAPAQASTEWWPSYDNYYGNDDGWASGYAPLSYDPYDDYRDGYWPSSYSPLDPDYASYGEGLFGGGDLLSVLLPMVLQSVMGGGAGLDGLGGMTGLGDVNVLPMQQASYAPYASTDGDLTSLLLPSLLGNNGLF